MRYKTAGAGKSKAHSGAIAHQTGLPFVSEKVKGECLGELLDGIFLGKAEGPNKG